MKSRRQLTASSVTYEGNLTIRLDEKDIYGVRIYESTLMRWMKKWSLDWCKKKIGSLPYKEEGTKEVDQDLEEKRDTFCDSSRERQSHAQYHQNLCSAVGRTRSRPVIQFVYEWLIGDSELESYRKR